jgi:hypothetical protein
MRKWLLGAAARAAVGLLVVALLACLGSLAADGGAIRSDEVVLESSTGGRFSIRGRILGLYPGKRGTLTLRLVNANRFAIRVTSVHVRVANANRACTSWYLLVDDFAGSVRVAARSSRRLRLDVRMRRAAPDACKGATFRLSYRGKALRA